MSTVRLALQQRQEGLDPSPRGIAAHKDTAACKDSPGTSASRANEELGSAVPNQPSIWATARRAKNEPEAAQVVLGGSSAPQGKESAPEASAPLGFPCHNLHESVGRSGEALAEDLWRISLGGRVHEEASRKEPDTEYRESPFQGLPQQTYKTPHYKEVLERRAKKPVQKKGTFKPNR